MIQHFFKLFTILAIIGGHNMFPYSNYISGYINMFDSNAFDELNLMCYISLRGIIKSTVTYIAESAGTPLPYSTLSDIGDVNYLLHRFTGWKKYLKNDQTIWSDYYNVMNWHSNSIDIENTINVVNDIMSTFDKSKFSDLEMTTPLGSQFMFVYNNVTYEEIKEMLINIFMFCKRTLKTISAKADNMQRSLYSDFVITHERITFPMMSNFGCVLLLMNQADITALSHFKTLSERMIYLVYIINVALQDAYRGIIYTLNRINISDPQISNYVNTGNFQNTNFEIMKMLISVFSNAVQLTEEMYNVKDIKSVKMKISRFNRTQTESHIMTYEYECFVQNFRELWSKKLFKSTQKESANDGAGSSTYYIEQDYDGLLLPDGVLIENEEVNPSIIGYYAVFDASGIHLSDVHYKTTSDYRIVLLMELNAWMKILYQTLQELNVILSPLGVTPMTEPKPDFKYDMEKLKEDEKYFL